MSVIAALAAQAACGGEARATEQALPATTARAAHDAIRDVGGLSAAEIHGYRLTMAKVEAWHRAELDATRSFIKNPSLQPKDDEQEGTDPEQILKAIERNPTVSAALRAQGLTPREGVKLLLAMVHSGMAASLEPGADLPEEVTPENVEFMRAHRAELDRMRQETSALEEQIPDEVADADADAIQPV
jgi:hypothetical protein